ncbi:MAG TPA: hypothetical protein VFN67_22295 [Polyangiales bacterium]|nr:hypothetical protein [Polyangiales bacterium]
MSYPLGKSSMYGPVAPPTITLVSDAGGIFPQPSLLSAAPPAKPVEKQAAALADNGQDPAAAADAFAEPALVQRIDAAVRANNFAQTLHLCALHQQRWPDGAFAMERDAVRAIASCGAHSPRAAEQAQRFLAEHSELPIAARVRAACPRSR